MGGLKLSETVEKACETILLVEDNERLSQLIKKNLERVGYQTEFTTNGATAIEKIREGEKSLLLLDYQLPDMNGKELIEELIESENLLPFIVITGQGDEKVAVEMMKLGARDYIIKDTALLDLLPQVIERVGGQLEIERQLARTEIRLHERECSLSALMENLPGMAYRCQNDNVRTMIFISKGGKELTGRELLDLEGIPYIQLIHIDDRDMVLSQIRSAVDEKRPFEIVYRIHSVNHEEKWVWEKGSGIFSEDGKLLAIEGFISDVSEKKQSDEALQRSEDKYRNLIERANDGVVIVQDDVFKFVNNRMAQMFRYEVEEIIGSDFSRFISPDFEEVVLGNNEDDLKRNGVVKYYETQAIRKDGEILTIYVNVGPIEYEGKPADFIFIRDITKHKKAEEALRISEEKYRTILEEIEEGYFEIDLLGNFTFFNDSISKILGYSKDELMGMNYQKFTDEKNSEKVYKIFNKGYSSKKPLELFDFEVIRKNRDKRIIEVSASQMIDFKNETIGFRGIIRDVTDRKKAEEKLEKLNEEISEKNKELEQIVYVTSHDLRSPLVNIQGFGKELSYSIKDLNSILQNVEIPNEVKGQLSSIMEEDIPETMGFIKTSVSKMDSLLSGLLRLSRLGRSALTFENLDMNALVEDISKNFELKIKETESQIVIDKLPSCRGDKVQINQVFSNLINNALKYLDPERSGVIKITGEKNGDRVVYCVEDNGIGIPKRYINSIFEIFHRLNPEGVVGEGLGLTLVSKILSRNNGRIWVESEEGVGSRFFVSLPKIENDSDGGKKHE